MGERWGDCLRIRIIVEADWRLESGELWDAAGASIGRFNGEDRLSIENADIDYVELQPVEAEEPIEIGKGKDLPNKSETRYLEEAE